MSSEMKHAEREHGLEQLEGLLGSDNYPLLRVCRLQKEMLADGILSRKYKLLIALAIAVGSRADTLIQYYVSEALGAGLRRDEILEAVNVAIFMSGGLSVLSGVEAMAAVTQSESRARMQPS